MNIKEILTKYAKKGDKLYSPALGDVTYLFCTENCDETIIVVDKNGDKHEFNPGGNLCRLPGSECLLFPRAYQRDWNAYVQEQEFPFKVGDHVTWDGIQYCITDILDIDEDEGEDNIRITPVIKNISDDSWVSSYEIRRCDHFDPKTLGHYDKIIGWNASMGVWAIDYFQFIAEASKCKYVGMIKNYSWVIPYNSETESLVGTDNNLPDFYLNNED